jgi:hypothetical protein
MAVRQRAARQQGGSADAGLSGSRGGYRAHHASCRVAIEPGPRDLTAQTWVHDAPAGTWRGRPGTARDAGPGSIRDGCRELRWHVFFSLESRWEPGTWARRFRRHLLSRASAGMSRARAQLDPHLLPHAVGMTVPSNMAVWAPFFSRAPSRARDAGPGSTRDGYRELRWHGVFLPQKPLGTGHVDHALPQERQPAALVRMIAATTA